jgi:hypothetical protein
MLGDWLMIAPPLVIDEPLADAIIDRLVAVLDEATTTLGGRRP